MSKTAINYRTFDELMDEVRTDFRMYENEGMIEPAQLIKVAQRVNYELGAKLYSAKNTFLELDKGICRLPSDFHKANFALACGTYKIIQEIPSGTHREDIILESGCCKRCGEPDPTCACEKTYTVCCDTHVKVIEKRPNYTLREYSEFSPITFVKSGVINTTCFQGVKNSPYSAEIRGNFMYLTGIQNGNIYLCYDGALEDEDGNLLVLDHPLINEFYEYAIKQRILENLAMNGENVQQKMQIIEERLRTSRNNARSLINTPDLADMLSTWKNNRDRMYGRYYDTFRYWL